MKKKVIIMGAGGRDIHTFNTLFKNNKNYEVVCFTFSQIPGIKNKIYPASLAGENYPNGIPIYEEKEIEYLIKKYNVDEVILAYSDLLYEDVMTKASIVLTAGANFSLISPFKTMLKSKKPVIAITASRTGAGKSTISKKIVDILLEKKVKFAVIRHPMIYVDFEKINVVKLKNVEDLDKLGLTIEEKEEFEHYLSKGITCFEGIDYEKVLEEAEREADILIWDGGNNDFPFIKPDLLIVAVDPHRVGHEKSYPGEINVRMADIIIITKVNTAEKEQVEKTIENVKKLNNKAEIIEAEFVIEVDDPKKIENKVVAVVEDGPTITHGHLKYGAGYIAALQYKAKEIIDARIYAEGIYKEIYEMYPHIEKVIPTIGYSEEQIQSLENLIKKIPCETVILGTQSFLPRYLKIDKDIVQVKYYLKERKGRTLEEIIEEFLNKFNSF